MVVLIHVNSHILCRFSRDTVCRHPLPHACFALLRWPVFNVEMYGWTGTSGARDATEIYVSISFAMCFGVK